MIYQERTAIQYALTRLNEIKFHLNEKPENTMAHALLDASIRDLRWIQKQNEKETENETALSNDGI